ncbi:MAG TPA: hypothetical protein VKD24_09340 [Candidatus Angelobacter sp.]|nr:hypothetical protein [Candidatus Angelobacter sp.]
MVLLMCWTAITCTRQTPGNPSPNATQSNQSAENTPPRSAPAPTAAEERRPATTAAPPQATPSLAPPVAEVPPTPRPTPPPLVLPAGTLLTVTTSTAISAKSADTGQTFQGSLAQPVIYHGHTAIPAGASVTGAIVAAKQGGKIKGESELALQLTSIRVQGRAYPIVTSQYVQQQKGKGGRTAKLGVGGAAGGAIIGGIAGGGKGAAIGSLVGGGAGVAGSALTGNKELTIPAESVLQFKLAEPVKLSSGPASRPESETNQ